MQRSKFYTQALCFVMSFFSITLMAASTSLLVAPVCNDSINFSLDTNCQGEIVPDDLLEAPVIGTNYRIFITSPTDSTGRYSNNGTDRVVLLKTGYYKYAVVDDAGVSCWGIINAEDKLAPVFSNLPRDTFVRCHIELTEIGLGATKPTIIDGCDHLEPIFEIAQLAQGNTCDSIVSVNIIWKAIDNFGNEARDTQTIVFIRPKYTQVIAPKDIILSCGEDELSAIDDVQKTGSVSVAVGRIVNAVFIATDTVNLDANNNFCRYGLSMRDSDKKDDCGIQRTRIWDLVDWCKPNQRPTLIDTQYIAYTDTLAPEFLAAVNGNIQNATIVEFGDDCRYNVTLPTPKAVDNCDTLPLVEMYEVAQLINGTYIPIGKNINTITLPADTLRIAYRASDDCHTQLKEDTIFTYVITRDLTAPTAICTNNLVLSIANDFDLILQADRIDGGSEDACGDIVKEIRRMGTLDSFTTFISLPCSVIDSQLLVELRVTDASGNTNLCWTSVRVEDKVIPFCNNLPNDTITCDIRNSNDFGHSTDSNNNRSFDNGEWQNLTPLQIELYNLTFGDPGCKDNISCKSFTVQQQYQLLNQNCGAAAIKRRYRAIDTQNNISPWVEQQLTVNYQANWVVKFAPDWEGTCVDNFPLPYIDIQNGSCDKLQVTVLENIFRTDGENCLKVERIFQVINLCNYRPGTAPITINRIVDTLGVVHDSLKISSDSLASIGYFSYKQILKIIASEKPDLTISDDIDRCLSGIHSDTLINTGKDGLYCAELRTFTANATDCVGKEVEQYNWNFYENDIVIDKGTGKSFTKPVLPNAKYSVQFVVADACNNIAEAKRDFIFKDCIRPTLFVRRGVTLELRNRTISLKATDFDVGSSDNCTAQSVLLDNFRIWHESLGNAPTGITKVKALPKEITLSCAYLSTQKVLIYAFDEADNYDRVESFVIVQDNQESCLGAIIDGMVAGQIVDEKGAKVEAVTVAISGGKEAIYTTKIDGHYEFELQKNKTYSITPSKNINPLNGVTTFDLVLISKHILGIQKFTAPYQYIAADINQSGSITAFDLVQLRQVILNIIPEFPDNQSWRFVDDTYRFTTENPLNEPFKESVLIDNMGARQMNFNFVGVKIGDINGSASPNSLLKSAARQTKNNLIFQLEDRFVAMNEIVAIPFNINDLNKIEGLQFNLNFADMTFVELEEGSANITNFNQEITKNGQLAISWNKEKEGIHNDHLFTLKLKATKRDLLSNLLSIDYQKMVAEAYHSEQEIQGIQLDFSPIHHNRSFELFQNKPNPFRGETVIGFYLPKAEMVQLRVMDIQGKLLKDIHRPYDAGFHEMILDKQTLGGVGVLYYQLTAGNHTATKKMIVME